MAANRADFTLTFRRLCAAAENPQEDGGVRQLFAEPGAYDDWAMAWRRRLNEEGEQAPARAAAMRRVNPAFIPRNHVVEAMIRAAVEQQDFEPFELLLQVVTSPFEDQPDGELYATPARPEECVLQTFCGT